MGNNLRPESRELIDKNRRYLSLKWWQIKETPCIYHITVMTDCFYDFYLLYNSFRLDCVYILRMLNGLYFTWKTLYSIVGLYVNRSVEFWKMYTYLSLCLYFIKMGALIFTCFLLIFLQVPSTVLLKSIKKV